MKHLIISLSEQLLLYKQHSVFHFLFYWTVLPQQGSCTDAKPHLSDSGKTPPKTHLPLATDAPLQKDG